MAPGSSNNQNNNRQTGTKPKSKASKKNAVPQEIVAPTRRDQLLNQQLNVLVDWATVSSASSVVQNNNTQQQLQQQHFSGAQHPPTSGQQQQHQQQSQGQNVLLKPRNNRTPGEGTCYEIDNLSLQDNSRYIPVRPIVRRNLLNESASGEQNEPHNTAVGVVIPTTPNSALQQTFRLNEGASASGSGGPIGSTHSVNNLLHSGASAGHSASGGASSTGVIPKQQHILNPLLLLQQQQQQQIHQQQQQAGQTRSTSSPLSYRVPDGASQNQLNLNKNSNHHQQQQQQQQHQQQYNQPHLATAAVPSTSSGSRYGSATLPFNTAGATVEETLNQIQEYIKLTTNLISSVQIDNVSGVGRRQQRQRSMGDESCYFVPINSATLEDVRHSDTELNGGPRPQSVQSISTNQSTTPVPPSASCDELRYRMETQSKNMQALKEQQAHLLRLQQAARQQLQEMESIRHMHSASVAPPIESFQTVEQVQDGIGSIMERMRVLSTFIQNQQELSNMLGPEHDADVMADQVILQQKFAELRDKKSQMHNLVSELQNLNMDANRQFDGEAAAVPAEPRNVPIELTHAPAPASDARNATKIFLNGGGSTMEGTSGGLNPVATVEGMSVPAHRQLGEEQRANGHMASSAAVDEEDDEGQLNEEEASVLNGTADMLSEKINEINAMKSQLRRLKEMMDTVKLIEMKTGHESIDEEEEDEEDAPEDEEEGDDEEEEGATAIAMQQQQQQPPHARSSRSRSRSMSSAPITLLPDGTTIPNEADGSELSNQEREQLNKRVEALHAMTQDLREQAKSIAAERDRLKHARNDLHKRRNNVMELQQQAQHQSSEKLTNHVASFVSLAGPSGRVPAGPKERQQMELKAELEQKRRELERIEKMTQSIKKNTELSRSAATEGVGAHEPTTSAHDPKPAGPSSVVSSSVESCSGGAGSHHRGTPSTHTTIPPAPAPSAISGSLQNNTAGSNATNDSKTNSADSGVTSDIFAHAQLESASYQSSSTRSFPPPMPDICNRNAAADRYRMKRSELDADGAPVGGGGGGGAAGARDHRGSSPWPVFGTSGGAGGLSSSNTGPHSPHYGHPYGPGMHDLSHHAPGAGYVGVGVGAYGSSWSTGGGPYGVAANLLPPHAATPNTPPDPIVFQHIMQTQQMLMNSITQCNQLLWIQQREINNLNNAVLLLQERILGTNSSMLLHETHGPPMAATLIRAESTPPNNSSLNASNAAATTASSMYTRARSEQPMMSHQQSSPYHHPHALHQPTPSSMLQSMPPFTQQPPYSPHAAMPPNHALMSPQPLVPNASQCLPRNNTNPLAGQAGLPPSGASAGRLRSSVRPLNINTLNNALYDEQSGGGGGGGVAAGTDVGLANEYGNTGSVAPNMINNLCSSSSQPATPTPAMGQQQQQQQQPHHHQPHSSSSLRFGQNYNNLNNTVNNNLSNANMQNNHNLYSQQQQQQQESSSQQQTQALNNQVLPGVRANNYWDNFRSYSRQNLLSSNSCKSNEESCSQSGSAGGGGSGGGGGGGGSSAVVGAGAANGIGCAGSGTVSGGGGGAGFSGGSAGGGTGCNTINNQLQRNNSNASNQYMNNQSNKYQQSLNITRNNSLSNANQANSAGMCQELDSSMSHGYHPNQDGSMTDDCAGQMVDHHHPQQQQQQVVQQQAPLPNVSGQPMHGARAAQQTFPSQQPILSGRQQHRGQPVGTVQAQHPYGHTHQPSVQPQSVQSQHSSSGLVHQTPPHQQQIAPQQQQQQQQQQAHSHHAPLNQSNSLDLGELQFHTNPINLGLANKTHPKASGHKKYPLSLRSCRDAGAGGEGSSGCYVSGGGDMNLASTCTYQHDSKSTSKLFEALKENVYQEVKNLITANESRPHFLIQLFRELQLISSDPLRQRTLQSIQELYNRYIESTLQEENHVNNVGSNNLLASSGLANMPEGVNVGGESINAEQPRNTPPREQRSEESTVELEVVQNYTNLRQQQQQQQQQQQYHYIPAAGSDQTGGNLPATSAGEVLADGSLPNAPSTSSNSPPGAGRRLSAVRPLNQEQLVPLAVANSEIINIIMGDIVSVINSVDYINDSVLFKIAGVICNHATGGASMDYGQPSGDAGQQHHHHHHHQHHYHHHHARTGQSPAASLLAAASFLSAQGDDPQAGGGDMSSGAAGAGSAGGDVFSREDFLRHLESWNRTDKDEFISNLENFLNNILLRSSAVEGEEGDEEEDAITGVPLSVGGQQSAAYVNEVPPDGAIGYEGGTAGNSAGSDVGGNGNGIVPFNGEEQHPLESAVVVSSSSSNVVYSSTTYDLAEADQVCDMENPSGNSMAAGGPSGGASAAAVEHPTGGTNFDDRWTVVVQKKPATSAVEEQQVGANGRDEGRPQPRMGGMQQQQQQQQTHGGMNGGPSSTNGNIPSGGGGNNGNNINNNWQSEEVADEHLEQTEEHRSSYY
ncbi:uncharacterized protein LOC1280384 isoform X1 [Anopheles gambiae]|uniref:uncharacterized protein LOC1280384 isoform X1 n=1 Tax=Anopheles gambiae TaxID=7165 RepID=UPI002AC8AEA0|nr:uncharacterized protein LOC1280384 isoform X1 [Anopheles gambiae]